MTANSSPFNSSQPTSPFPPPLQEPALTDLAREFGTPLYVYDDDRLRAQYRGLRERLHSAVEIFYSVKANPNIAVTQSLVELGAGAEVSSSVELTIAQRAGTEGGRILYLGPGKSHDEIELALEAGACLVAESLPELDIIDAAARRRGSVADVLLRVNPAFTVKGSDLTMGGLPRQFGVDEEHLMELEPSALAYQNVRVRGIHVYMGTRVLVEATVVENTRLILDLAHRLAERLGIGLGTIDIGGGLGVAYHPGETDLDVDVLADGLAPVVDEFRLAYPDTRLIMELGRYLAAPMGSYLVRVRYVKESRGERFAICDGGTNHHLAAVGLASPFRRNFPVQRVADNNNKDDDSADTAAEPVAWNVTGPLCTPSDTLGKAVPLPDDIAPGDLIAVTRSGAYGPTASPVLFLSHGYPAEVLVRDGRAHLVRRRDTVDDLLDRQAIPTWPRPSRSNPSRQEAEHDHTTRQRQGGSAGIGDQVVGNRAAQGAG